MYFEFSLVSVKAKSAKGWAILRSKGQKGHLRSKGHLLPQHQKMPELEDWEGSLVGDRHKSRKQVTLSNDMNKEGGEGRFREGQKD